MRPLVTLASVLACLPGLQSRVTKTTLSGTVRDNRGTIKTLPLKGRNFMELTTQSLGTDDVLVRCS